MSKPRDKMATAQEPLQISNQASTAIFGSQVNLGAYNPGLNKSSNYLNMEEVDKQPRRKNSPFTKLDTHFAYCYKENLVSWK